GGERPKYAPGVMAAIYRSFVGQSRLFNRIDGLIGGIQFKMYGGYDRPLSAEATKTYERDSIALTRMLLTKLREKYRDAPAVMVNCDGNESGPNKQWKALARDAGFIPLSGPSDFLLSVKPGDRRDIFHADGAHLSEEGNRLYGTIAGDEIVSLRLAALNRR
ncbi:MAG TPA: hypothetical protein VGC27_02340, partial [Rhizomicrobium sp.]